MDWPDQQVREVADGVVAVLQGQGESGVANAGFVFDPGTADALVVDTMMFPEMAAGLVAALDARGLRADTVLNTHHHIDHVGGNVVISDGMGSRIVAHPTTIRTIEGGGHPVAVYDGFMPAFAGRFAEMELVTPEPLPDRDYDFDLDLRGGAQLHRFSPAHTPADVAVWVEPQRALFAGDLCFFGVTPLAIQGLLSNWVAALDALIALSPDVVIPGHGPVGGGGDIEVARSYLQAVLDHGRAAVANGTSLDDAVAEFRCEPAADWIERERDLVNIERAMQEARHEISPDDVSAIPASFARLLT